MSNRNYTSTSVPAFGAALSSSTIRDEFTAVSNGFTGVEAELDLKATISTSQTLTNKAINLASNTLTTTLAQLNTAVSDADLCPTTGNGGGAFAVGALTATGSSFIQNGALNITNGAVYGGSSANSILSLVCTNTSTNIQGYTGDGGSQRNISLQASGANVLIGSTTAVTGAKLEVTGTLSISALPTSDPHVAGALWRSTNTVMVSTG